MKKRRTATAPRKGIALILALVLIVILSVAASAALGMVSSERRVVEDQQAASEAHAMARSAYDQFLTNPTGIMIDLYRRCRSTRPDATLGVPPVPPKAMRLASRL